MPENKTLTALEKKTRRCRACRLAATRTTVVFGEGSPGAEVFFIGEGPGRQEDISGRPFVGPSGEILTLLIEEDMGLSRNDVYITSIVKCRPTHDLLMQKDRPPEKDEISACTPILLKQIEIIKPRVIVTLGNPATHFILKTRQGITSLHGTWHEFMGIPVMPACHPSYILRNGGASSLKRKEAAKDLKKVTSLLKKQGKNRK